MAERITSRTNPLISHIRKIGSSRSYRRAAGEYLGDGGKLLEEAVKWGAALTVVVCTAGAGLPELPEGVRVVEVPEDVMRSVSPMESPQGVLFLAKVPDGAIPERLSRGCYLALEGVQDPGNVGTILRTADAFGAEGVFLLPGCADIYNPKVVRASMGAVFRLPVWSCDLEALRRMAAEACLPVLGTALREDTVDVREVDMRQAVVLVGSEGRGLSEEALEVCGQTVRIPMRGRCESLNAAVAAAVVLWESFRE